MNRFSFTKLKKVEAIYSPLTVTLEGQDLETFIGFVKDITSNYLKWEAITTPKNKTYCDINVTVEGWDNTNMKKVTFEKEVFGSRVYDVAVTEKGIVTIKKKESNVLYTLNNDKDKTLTITNAPAGLYFTVTY